MAEFVPLGPGPDCGLSINALVSEIVRRACVHRTAAREGEERQLRYTVRKLVRPIGPIKTPLKVFFKHKARV